MARKQRYYVVSMYKWTGDHFYVHGVYSTKTKAIKAGEEEQKWRGNRKYFPEVTEFGLDEHKTEQVIYYKEQAPEWGWWKEQIK